MSERKTNVRHTKCTWTTLWKLIIAVLVTIGCARAQINVLTANYDANRTNSNPGETKLGPETVNSTSFGKIGAFPVDGQIYAQPLYVTGVHIEGAGLRNVVYVATMHNSVYALDANVPQSTVPLWAVNLGPSILSAVFNFTDILPEVGILSTPVIDPARGVIYVVADTMQGAVPAFFLHALSLVDGSEQLNGPVQITASVRGTGAGTDGNGNVALDPMYHLQRPGLALTNGQLYILFGSHADTGYWHGWIVAYDASNLQHQTAVFNTTPNGAAGSIWQAGRGPVIDPQGDIFVVTGNGDYDGATSFSESVLHLAPETRSFLGTTQLNMRGWFTPEDWSTLNENDWDFGSSGAMLVPGTSTLIAGSKAGLLYILSTGQLSHSRVWIPAQSVQANQWGMFDMGLWNNENGPIVYIAEPYNALKAFQMLNGQLSTTPSSEFSISSSFFVGLAVSSDGGKSGTGLVWLTTGNDDVSQVPGTLHALDAGNLSELWNSDMNGERDGLGRFAKFATPTVADGKVFVPTFSNALVIYGLLSSGPKTSGAPVVSAVVNGASFVGGAVAPGEIVAIFGANLGASQLTQMQPDVNGTVSSTLAGTQVFVNGVPTSLLYVSATQIGAVTPFGLSGTTAQFQVVYNGRTSAAVTVPVTNAMPGLFSVHGDGGGLGVFNSDGTTSDWNALTKAGSVVTFYATGAGQTFPAGVDGSITSGLASSSPLLPVKVFIDGQNAEVVYAGAAPNMVAGVLQLNVRVPETISGDDLQVIVKVGDSVCPNFLWIDVL
jgi:uncharacterized protein (TIGR03437 family)